MTRHRTHPRSAVSVALAALSTLGGAFAVLFAGCGSESSADVTASLDGSPEPLDATESFADVVRLEGAAECVNLKCFQDPCSGAPMKTTLTGTVFDPAGKNPLYNAIVYVPNAPLAPVAEGLSCDTCGVVASGSPIAIAITAADGTFTLENVPAGVDVPLVIQLGKWRRSVVIPKVAACQSTAITDVELTRLPRNRAEGHIPRFAVATGGADPIECLLRKAGIDDAEFTLPSGDGRVHLFHASGGIALATPDAGDADASDAFDGATPPASELWDSAATLEGYDAVMLPCEGGPYAEQKSEAARQAMLEYVNAGGRLFVTHFASSWLESGPAPLPSAVNWEHDDADRSDNINALPVIFGEVEIGFPKGKAFADWLAYVGASTDAGYAKLPLEAWRHDVGSVNKPPSQPWIRADTRTGWPPGLAPPGAREVIQHFTFNTPIEAGIGDAGEPLQCGKVVFSDFHVSVAERVEAEPFPRSCKDDPMTAQEKALEFMLFDLSSCIQKDDEPPPVPPLK
jgi:hypothetical protein